MLAARHTNSEFDICRSTNRTNRLETTMDRFTVTIEWVLCPYYRDNWIVTMTPDLAVAVPD